MSYYQNELLWIHALIISRTFYNSLNKKQKELFKLDLSKNGVERIILIEFKRKYSIKI